MVPSPWPTAAIMPEVPLAPSPTLDRPDLVGRVAPGALAGLLEVVGEVLRGAGLVGAVNRRDRGRGQLGAGFSAAIAASFHLVILPSKIWAIVFAESCRSCDALHVVEDRDRAHVVRDLDGVGAAALLGRVDLALVGVERGVGAGEVDAARVELLDAGTRAGRVVVHGDVAPRNSPPWPPRRPARDWRSRATPCRPIPGAGLPAAPSADRCPQPASCRRCRSGLRGGTRCPRDRW